MLRQPRRLIAAGVAIVLGVAFVAASLLLGDSLRASLTDAAAGPVADASVVVMAYEKPLTRTAVDQIAGVPGVTAARPIAQAPFDATVDGAHINYVLLNTPPLTERTTLLAGRLPTADGEVAADTVAASGRGLAVGSTLTSADTTLTVVGIIKAGSDASDFAGLPTLFGTDASVARLAGGYQQVIVRTDGPTADAMAAIRNLPAVRAEQAKVQAAGDVLRERTASMTGGAFAVTVLLLCFATTALFTAALVIANTFSILIAQRTRQLALLRCVGATRGQVFRSVLGEALAVGAAASLAGLAAGTGLTLLAIRLSQGGALALTRLDAQPASLLLPLMIGVGVTLVAALVPARQATRISPLAALRTTAAAPAAGPGRRRIASGVLLVAAGTLALVAASALTWSVDRQDSSVPVQVLLGIGGGVVSFVGILLLAPLLVPALARAAAPLLRAFGPSGELAAENAVRNPRRAAATASALLVGVTLITMMSVGAASAEASLLARLDGRFPVDATVIGDGSLGAAAMDAARSSRGVQQVASVGYGGIRVEADGREYPFDAYGLPTADAGVARNPSFATGLTDATIVLPRTAKIASGTRVTVTGDRGSATLTAVQAARSGTPALLTPATLARVATSTPQLWVRFADGVDPISAASDLGKSVAAVSPGVTVSGAAAERALVKQTLDTVLAVVVGLLAVAVLIALVGIGNTLSLSVLERSHESALLRALGLSRRQLRRSVGLEAVLLAAVAVALGLGLGLAYGVAGAYTVVGTATSIVIDVPWARLTLAAAVAIGAGWLASVLPAARAATVSPAAALAEE